MKAIIIGAGRIGRGFIAELMTLNDVDITFFDINQEFVDEMNRANRYTVHALGNANHDVIVENVRAYSFDSLDDFARIWDEADYIFTACGGKNLRSIGERIGEAYKLRDPSTSKISNIVTCENWISPVEDLTAGIMHGLTESDYSRFLEHIGVSESVILCTGTGSPDGRQTNPVDTWVQDLRYLPINKDLIKGPLPDWKYVEFVSEFGNLLTQKIYTNNTSVATVSYLGYLKGIKHVADAANDPQILPILDQLYTEINAVLIHGLGIDSESQLKFSKAAKAKYTDYAIVDQVTRIARDPIRKLGPDDRFIGPMTIALKANIVPEAMALGAAAAIYYDYAEDETATTLRHLRVDQGIDEIFKEVCKIDPEGEIASWIKNGIARLKEEGWITYE